MAKLPKSFVADEPPKSFVPDDAPDSFVPDASEPKQAPVVSPVTPEYGKAAGKALEAGAATAAGTATSMVRSVTSMAADPAMEYLRQREWLKRNPGVDPVSYNVNRHRDPELRDTSSGVLGFQQAPIDPGLIYNMATPLERSRYRQIPEVEPEANTGIGMLYNTLGESFGSSPSEIERWAEGKRQAQYKEQAEMGVNTLPTQLSHAGIETGVRLLGARAFGAQPIPGLAGTSAGTAGRIANYLTNAAKLAAFTYATTDGSAVDRFKAASKAFAFASTPALSGFMPGNILPKAADIGLNRVMSRMIEGKFNPASPQSYISAFMDVFTGLGTRSHGAPPAGTTQGDSYKPVTPEPAPKGDIGQLTKAYQRVSAGDTAQKQGRMTQLVEAMKKVQRKPVSPPVEKQAVGEKPAQPDVPKRNIKPKATTQPTELPEVDDAAVAALGKALLKNGANPDVVKDAVMDGRLKGMARAIAGRRGESGEIVLPTKKELAALAKRIGSGLSSIDKAAGGLFNETKPTAGKDVKPEDAKITVPSATRIGSAIRTAADLPGKANAAAATAIGNKVRPVMDWMADHGIRVPGMRQPFSATPEFKASYVKRRGQTALSLANVNRVADLVMGAERVSDDARVLLDEFLTTGKLNPSNINPETLKAWDGLSGEVKDLALDLGDTLSALGVLTMRENYGIPRKYWQHDKGAFIAGKMYTAKPTSTEMGHAKQRTTQDMSYEQLVSMGLMQSPSYKTQKGFAEEARLAGKVKLIYDLFQISNKLPESFTAKRKMVPFGEAGITLPKGVAAQLKKLYGENPYNIKLPKEVVSDLRGFMGKHNPVATGLRMFQYPFKMAVTAMYPFRHARQYIENEIQICLGDTEAPTSTYFRAPLMHALKTLYGGKTPDDNYWKELVSLDVPGEVLARNLAEGGKRDTGKLELSTKLSLRDRIATSKAGRVAGRITGKIKDAYAVTDMAYKYAYYVYLRTNKRMGVEDAFKEMEGTTFNFRDMPPLIRGISTVVPFKASVLYNYSRIFTHHLKNKPLTFPLKLAMLGYGYGMLRNALMEQSGMDEETRREMGRLAPKWTEVPVPSYRDAQGRPVTVNIGWFMPFADVGETIPKDARSTAGSVANFLPMGTRGAFMGAMDKDTWGRDIAKPGDSDAQVRRRKANQAMEDMVPGMLGQYWLRMYRNEKAHESKRKPFVEKNVISPLAGGTTHYDTKQRKDIAAGILRREVRELEQAVAALKYKAKTMTREQMRKEKKRLIERRAELLEKKKKLKGK